jgi:hypothetical protein
MPGGDAGHFILMRQALARRKLLASLGLARWGGKTNPTPHPVVKNETQ